MLFSFIILINFLFITLVSIFKPNYKWMSFIFFLFIITNAYIISQRSLLLPDTNVYASFFEKLSFNFQFENNNSYFEEGFILFSMGIKIIFGDDFRLYFFIIASISLYFLFKIIIFFFAHHKNPITEILIIAFIYIVTVGFNMLFISIRVGLAFLIGFYGFLLIKKSPVKSLILLFIGYYFHNSIIILLIALPFYYFPIFRKRIPTLSFFGVLIPLFLIAGINNWPLVTILNIFRNIPIIYDRFFPYFDLRVNIIDGLNSLIRIFFLFIIVSLLLMSNKIVTKFTPFILIFIVGFSIRLLFINYPVIYRIEEFFTFIFVILIQKEQRFNGITPGSLLKILVYTYFVVSNIRLIY